MSTVTFYIASSNIVAACVLLPKLWFHVIVFRMLYWVSGNSTASSIYVSTYDGEILDFTQFDGLVTALHYDNSAEYLLAVDEQNAFYNCNADSKYYNFVTDLF